MADRISSMTDPATGGPTPSLATLVGGIVSDLQTLIRQELQLARREVQQEFDKAKFGIAMLGGGLALLALAVMPLLFLLVYLIKEYTSIPLWGCFGIIGGGFALLGGLLIAAGVAKVRQVHLVPPQTAETMRENVQWLKNQT
jgi:uncharacterized membrane protein YqjE